MHMDGTGSQRRAARLGAVLLVALTVVLVAAPAAASFTSATYPTQSLGNRGNDVRAIQYLLRARGYGVPVTGTFGTTTVSAVRSFQRNVGVTQSGVVDPGTWSRLVLPVGPGSTGDGVRALQLQLRHKRRASLPVTGTFGSQTRDAVFAFQRHAGLSATGRADPATWRSLVWHYDYPEFPIDGLCDYSTVNRTEGNWGTAAAVGQTEAASIAFAGKRLGGVAVGDVSLEHGGKMPGHQTHRVGLDVDLRPVRRDREQCSAGTNYRSSTYDRSATRELIRTVRAAAPGHVKLIYFNDPQLIREGLVTWYAGHDDHLHVRYCEVRHALAAYRC
jgi:peptidoglycan hydrolase-like protein with peptidoglycan-binding domain